MAEVVTKRLFKGQLANGFVSLILCFIASLILWPLWSILANAIFSIFVNNSLIFADSVTYEKLLGVMVEGSFLWLVIVPWIWMVLCFDCYGKDRLKLKQPWSGIAYSFAMLVVGAIGFLVMISFMGIWWKPFNLATMFTPVSVADMDLALLGWGVAKEYALCVVVVQIAFVTMLHKWPFAGKSNALMDNISNFATSSLVTFIFFISVILPSFMQLFVGDIKITSEPFGSFLPLLAFLFSFVIISCVPVMGGELYPLKFFAKKQPYMGIVGVLIAILAGFAFPPLLRNIFGSMNLLPGAPIDVVVSSLLLTIIIVILFWNELFDGYPGATMVPITSIRILTRVAVWVFGGLGLGILWIKTYSVLPIGGNNFGFGFHTMGVIAGQFTFLITFLIFHANFDKWPLVQKLESKEN